MGDFPLLRELLGDSAWEEACNEEYRMRLDYWGHFRPRNTEMQCALGVALSCRLGDGFRAPSAAAIADALMPTPVMPWTEEEWEGLRQRRREVYQEAETFIVRFDKGEYLDPVVLRSAVFG